MSDQSEQDRRARIAQEVLDIIVRHALHPAPTLETPMAEVLASRPSAAATLAGIIADRFNARITLHEMLDLETVQELVDEIMWRTACP